MNLDSDIGSAKLNQVLLAKLRLQRYIFATFAMVLFLLGSVGLSAWRSMEKDRNQARTLAENAQNKADVESANTHRVQSALTKSLEDNRKLRRSHSELLLHLAVVDFSTGRIASARVKYQQAVMLDPPTWSPVVASLFQPHSLKMNTGRTRAMALDWSSRYVLAACDSQGSLMLKLLDAKTGRVLDEHFYPEHSAEAEVFWWRGSDSGLLRIGDQAMGFVIHKSKLVMLDEPTPWPKGSAATLNGQAVAVRSQTELHVFRYTKQRQLHSTNYKLNTGVFGATILPDGSLVYADKTGVKLLNDDVDTLIYTPDIAAIDAHYFYAGNSLYIGLRSSTHIEYAAIALDASREPVIYTAEVASSEKSLMRFLRNGTLLLANRGGKTLTVTPTGITEISLGEVQASTAIWHPRGILFGSARNGLRLRPNDMNVAGESLLSLLASTHAQATPHGFICTSLGGNNFVYRPDSRYHSAGTGATVKLTANGIYGSDGGRVTLPAGTVLQSTGELLGVSDDGKLLLWNNGLKLRLSDGTMQSVNTNLTQLPNLWAANDKLVATILPGKAVLSRYGSSTETIELPIGFEPSLLTVSDTGFAVKSGRSVFIWDNGSSYPISTDISISSMALLYGNQILALSDGDSLVLIEAKTGRRLWANEVRVRSMAATSDNTLLIVADSQLREIRFSD